MTSIGITAKYEKEAEKFYKKLLLALVEIDIPFIIGGTYAVKYYTGIKRPTKDIDIFCKAGDYPKIMQALVKNGFKIDILDDRWLGKATYGKYFADVIWGSIPNMWPIDDKWIKHAQMGEILGYDVRITPPEELIVSKAFRMGRSQFDGADITHIILKQGKNLNWKAILNRMDASWEILFTHIMLFRFTYPSERDIVPKQVMKELITRLKAQLALPTPKDKVSRGSLLSHRQYQIAYTDWGYKDVTDFFLKQ